MVQKSLLKWPQLGEGARAFCEKERNKMKKLRKHLKDQLFFYLSLGATVGVYAMLTSIQM
jgi:hypothetical protein